MTVSPAITAALALSVLLASITHLLVGGDGRRLLGLILSAGLGFALGQGFGEIVGTESLRLGPLHLLPALIGALSAVIVTALATRRHEF